MKISKLFHWLYALLMFLPLFVFLPSAFYYGFNSGAVAPQYVKTPLYDTNEVDSVDDLEVNRVYHIEDIRFEIDDFEQQDNYLFEIVILKANEIWQNDGTMFLEEIYAGNYDNRFDNEITVTIRCDNTGAYFSLSFSNYNGYIYASDSDFGFDWGFDNIDFCIKEDNYLNSFKSYIVDKSSDTVISSSDYQVYEYTENGSITTAMCQAWEDVWHNDLFSWSYDTFLTRPFKYITDMFSIPQDNVLINCFSYWLSISIVWLCFDVIIYVPQIAHRWLDKASLE